MHNHLKELHLAPLSPRQPRKSINNTGISSPRIVTKKITKVVIAVAGYGTRFLPESKIVPKELLPLVDQPMFVYNVQEIKDSGINQIVFVLPENKKTVLDYFKSNPKLEGLLKKHGQNDRLEKLKKINQESPAKPLYYLSTHPTVSSRIATVRMAISGKISFEDYIERLGEPSYRP